MTLFSHVSRYRIFILWILITLVVTSCGRPSEPLPDSISTAIGTPLLAGTPEVAYGSSLSEWEEVVQADVTQTTSSDETPVPPEPTSPLATTTTTEITETASSNETAVETASASSSATATTTGDALPSSIGTPFTLNDVVYRQITWEGLIPADFTSDAIMAKYEEQLAELEDGSAEASELYAQMKLEFDSAPANEVLNQVPIRIPGFITPLEYTDDTITEFLLVPYFGACVHVPAPPANQTVLVKVAEGQSLKIEDSYDPVWVMGKLAIETTTTELAAAGYNIDGAIIEPYTNQE